jgi:hypothetical protein
MAGSAQYSPGAGTAVSIAACPPTVTPGPLGWFYISNGGTVSCYIGGGSAVTSSNGVAVAASGTINGYLFAGDNLYAVAASGTGQLSVLQTGV